MKKFILIIFILLLYPFNLLAISDSEFLEIKRQYPEFNNADKLLIKYWKDIQNLKDIDQDKFNLLKKDQINWVKNERDIRARQLMNEGLPKYQAYTQAIQERASYLLNILNNSNINNKNTIPEVTNINTDPLHNSNKKNINNNQEVASKKIDHLKNSNDICKFFMDITILQNAEYNKQYNKNYNKDKDIKNYNPKEIIDIIYGYYGEPRLGDSNEYHNKMGNDYHNCMIKNGLKHYYNAGIPSSLYLDDINRYENPLQKIYDIMNEYEYIKSEQIRKDEEKRKEEERIKRIEEQRLAQIEYEKKKKEIIRRGCLKIISDYDISEEEYDYIIPASISFGDLLCYGKMGEAITSFSKPNLFNDSYTLEYELNPGQPIKLRFKIDENSLFTKQAHKSLNNNGRVLNIEVIENNEKVNLKSFGEARLAFPIIVKPLLFGIKNIEYFEEYFK